MSLTAVGQLKDLSGIAWSCKCLLVLSAVVCALQLFVLQLQVIQSSSHARIKVLLTVLTAFAACAVITEMQLATLACSLRCCSEDPPFSPTPVLLLFDPIPHSLANPQFW